MVLPSAGVAVYNFSRQQTGLPAVNAVIDDLAVGLGTAPYLHTTLVVNSLWRSAAAIPIIIAVRTKRRRLPRLSFSMPLSLILKPFVVVNLQETKYTKYSVLSSFVRRVGGGSNLLWGLI